MKFSIITPVYNGEKYIAETIESVLSQKGEFEIEYIIQDGGSTDKTVGIIKAYQNKLETGLYPIRCLGVTLSFQSEKDDGMYDAINKGFEKATGNIYAWINADDFYLPNSFKVIEKTFKKFSNIKWLKGTSCVAKENGEIIYNTPSFIYNQEWIRMGIYGRYAYFIQQESVFWRKSLWEKIGSIDTKYTHAGDYWLWNKFAKYTSLYSINKEVSCFRRVPTSLSNVDRGQRYQFEQEKIIPLTHSWLETRVKIFFWLTNKLRGLKPVWVRLYPYLFKKDQNSYVSIEMGEPVLLKTTSYIT